MRFLIFIPIFLMAFACNKADDNQSAAEQMSPNSTYSYGSSKCTGEVNFNGKNAFFVRIGHTRDYWCNMWGDYSFTCDMNTLVCTNIGNSMKMIASSNLRSFSVCRISVENGIERAHSCENFSR